MKREFETPSEDQPQSRELTPEEVSGAFGSPEDVRKRVVEELAPIEARNKTEKGPEGNELRENMQALDALTGQTEERAAVKGYRGPLSGLAKMGRRYLGVALLSLTAFGCSSRIENKVAQPSSPGEYPAAGEYPDASSTSSNKYERARQKRTKEASARERNRARIRQRTQEWRTRDAAEMERLRKKAEREAEQGGPEESEEPEDAGVPKAQQSRKVRPEVLSVEKGPKTMQEEVGGEIDEVMEKRAVDIARTTGQDLQKIRKQLGLGKKEQTGRVIIGRPEPYGATSRQTGEPTPEQKEESYQKFRERIEAKVGETTKPLEMKMAQDLIERIKNQLETNQLAFETGDKMLYDTTIPDETRTSIEDEVGKLLEMSKNLIEIRNKLEKGEVSAKDAMDEINKLKKIENSTILQKIEKQRAAQRSKEIKESNPYNLAIDRAEIAEFLRGSLGVPATESLADNSVSFNMKVVNKKGEEEEKTFKINPSGFEQTKRYIEGVKRALKNQSEDEKQQAKEALRKTFAAMMHEAMEKK